MKNYNEHFFNYVNVGATRSAQSILPLLRDFLEIDSVLDVGCGQGAWLNVWNQLGLKRCRGIDGHYVDTDELLIPREFFVQRNLERPFDIHETFDLVQCLEVAEHLPSSSAEVLVSSLVKHGEIVMFSAATKGQGGHHHINEQSYGYWRKLFKLHNYLPLDLLRPLIRDNKRIEPWYRYNILIYVSAEITELLPGSARGRFIPDDQEVPDLSPLSHRARKLLTRCVPASVITPIAGLLERIVSRRRVRFTASP